jgi:hypothetical protein
MTDAEKAAIVAELERLYDEWQGRFSKEIAAGETVRSLFPSGITFGLSFAIEVVKQTVQAGGALPPETNEEGK